MKKKILVLLTVIFLVSCVSKPAEKKEQIKTEEKNTKSNTALDEIDPIQNGDLKSEKDAVAESKAETYKAFEYTYSPQANHNKDKDKRDILYLKKSDKVLLDGAFEVIDQIISTCESENRYYRKSEMKTLKFQTEEITKLTEKWRKITKSK